MIDLESVSKRWSTMPFATLNEELQKLDNRIVLFGSSASSVVLNDLYIIRAHLVEYIDIRREQKFT